MKPEDFPAQGFEDTMLRIELGWRVRNFWWEAADQEDIAECQ